jgi:transcriptional regulator with XRE-family HTH domain
MAIPEGRCLLQPLLDSADMSQSELSRRTGIPREMIVKYIHKRAPIPLDKARLISRTIKCTIDDLYEWND